MVPGQPLDKTATALLNYHNALRAAAGSPPLEWNPVLAAHAADYARTMAANGQMVHSARAGRENERENLALSRHGTASATTLVQMWGNERPLFHAGIFPNICDGDWSQCAHYSQIIWSTTTDLGCGFAQGAQFDALVCRYSPPGNRDGKPVIIPGLQIVERPCVEELAPPTERG